MRRLVRFSLVAGATAAVIGGALAAVPSSAAVGGGGCVLQGTAAFTNGPNTTDHNFTYSFSGTLDQCGDSTSMSAGTLKGTITAGRTYAGHVEPKPIGSGTCATGKTHGTSFVAWNDGKLTIVDYDTTSATGAVSLTGTIRSSYTFADGTTVRTSRYAGDTSDGVLTFGADPTECAGSGVTSAPINGWTGIGDSTP